MAIEPETGGILALVSTPISTRTLFVDGITAKDWDALNNDPDKPMINRAIYGTYPPGSTAVHGNGGAGVGKAYRASDHLRSRFLQFRRSPVPRRQEGGHGSVDMYKSIVQSCDTYYYMLANDMGIDGIASFMGQMGLGQRTGIDIEGESEGDAAVAGVEKRRFKRPEQQKWYAGETISIGIGQGYNAYTPLQLALATATLANNGVMFRPHIVKYITDTKTGEKTMVEPEPIRRVPLKQQNIDVIKEGNGWRKQREGTGARAFAGAEYEAAGKTGTAQVYSLKGEKYEAGKVRTVCATTRCSSLSRRPTSRRSRSRCWSRTAVSAPSRRHRSHAWCSTTISSASCPRGRSRRQKPPSRPKNDPVARHPRRLWRGTVDHLDTPLLFITLAIMGVGLATVFSATYDNNNRLIGQFINMAVALMLMWAMAQVPPQKLMRFAVPLYVLGLVLVILVFLFGVKVNGADVG